MSNSAAEILSIMRPCFGKSQGYDSILVKDGVAKGYDMTHSVALPFPCDFNFKVKAADFVKVVAAADPEKLKFESSEHHIVIKSGRSRTKIPFLEFEEGFVPEPDADGWRPFDMGILRALGVARRFISQAPENDANKIVALTLFLTGGFVYGTNAHIMARVKCPETGVAALNLPHWAHSFLERRELEEWQTTENFAAFRLKGGGWYRSQLIEVAYPIQVLENLISGFTPETLESEIVIHGEFFDAFKEATGFGATHIKFSPTGLTARKEDVECHVDISLPLKRETIWNVAYMEAIIKSAEKFYPETSDENKGFFTGKDIDGIIMNVRN